MAIQLLAAALGRTAAGAAGRGLGEAALKKGASEAAGAAGRLNETLGKTAQGADKNKSALDKWYGGFVAFQSGLQKGQAHLSILSSTLGSISSQVVGTLTGAAGALQAIANPLEALVGLARPAVVEQFTLALNDAYAVIGRGLTPVLEAMTRAMRTVGDTYAKLLPVIQPALDGIADAIDIFFSGLGDLAVENAFALEVFANVLGNFARVAAFAARAVLELINVLFPLGKLFGRGSAKPGASSVGAAIRNVNITGSAEEFSRKAQEEAFRHAVTGGPTKDQVEILGSMDDLMNKILEAINKYLPQFPTLENLTNFVRQVLDALPSLPGGGTSAAEVGASIAEHLARRLGVL